MNLDIRTDKASTVRGIAVLEESIQDVAGRKRRAHINLPSVQLEAGAAKRITAPATTIELILNVTEHV